MEIATVEKCKTCFRPKPGPTNQIDSQWFSNCRCDRPYSPSTRFSLDVCDTCKQPVPPAANTMQAVSGICSCLNPAARKAPSQIKATEKDALEFDIASLRMTAANFPLERYSPIGILGDGGRATVILARDKVRGGKVAVKCFKRLPAALQASFLNESKKLQQLNHSSIVKIIDFGMSSAGTPYVVTDYKEAMNLEQCLACYGTPSHDVSTKIMAGICEAILAAQKQGILHRNIKPGNVLFYDDRNSDPTILLTDFAMYKGDVLEDAADARDLFYISADEARNMDYTERSEIYSIGSIGYLLLTGQAPFSDGNAREIKNLHALKLPPRICDAKFDNTRPKQLEALVEKCLEKDPSYRADSIAQLHAQLEALLRMQQAEMEQGLAIQKMQKALMIGGTVLAIMVVLLIALGAATFFGLFKH